MSEFEYKTVAAPRRARKHKGVKAPETALALTIEEAIAAEATEGWDYLRTDIFPVEEKRGLFSARGEVERAVMIFRRPVSSVHERLASRRGGAQLRPVQDRDDQELAIPPVGGATDS